MVQRLRIQLAMQRTWVRSLVRDLKSHMPQGNWAHMLQLESLCAAMKDLTWCNENHAASTKTNAVKNKIKYKISTWEGEGRKGRVCIHVAFWTHHACQQVDSFGYEQLRKKKDRRKMKLQRDSAGLEELSPLHQPCREVFSDPLKGRIKKLCHL